jgi:hypothetical protein
MLLLLHCLKPQAAGPAHQSQQQAQALMQH